MKKEPYVSPETEIVEFETEDIITKSESCPCECEYEGPMV